MKCGVCERPLGSRQEICTCGKDPYAGLLLDNRYKLLGKVAEGGMGMIYRALSLKNNELCAIKISRWIKPLQELRQLGEEDARKEEAARVEREVTLLQKAASQSQHIVQVYGDIGTHPEVGLWYPMEFLEGVLLSGHPLFNSPFPSLQVVELMIQLVEALGLAHGMGVVHRDLNPDNIFIVRHEGADEFIKLIDFGIARNLYDRRKLFDTGENLGFGHLHYLSPEQVGYSAKEKCYTRDMANQLDHRADIYSLGAITFHMLCGYPPFLKETFEDLANREWEFPPGLERALDEGLLPENLRDIIMSCLEPDPDKRPSDLYALRDMLDNTYRRMKGTPTSEGSAFTLNFTMDFEEDGLPLPAFIQAAEEFEETARQPIPDFKTPPPPPPAARMAPPPPPPAARMTPPPPFALEIDDAQTRPSSKVPEFEAVPPPQHNFELSSPGPKDTTGSKPLLPGDFFQAEQESAWSPEPNSSPQPEAQKTSISPTLIALLVVSVLLIGTGLFFFLR